MEDAIGHNPRPDYPAPSAPPPPPPAPFYSSSASMPRLRFLSANEALVAIDNRLREQGILTPDLRRKMTQELYDTLFL
jgi:hypothetical protein